MADTEEERPKKGAITEEEVCTLLQRYPASTVLSLLKEVSQFVNVKMDWHTLVEKSHTGIKSAREYQMLWRHLAYGQPLLERIDPEDQPLDDDSDLEFEVEAWPIVSTVDAMEASNCVQVLTSGSAHKSRTLNNSSFEVPRVSSENCQIQKRSQAAGMFGEGLDSNGLTSNNQKKRKQVLEEEDPELIANVRKGESKVERNTQRAQRANTIKKKQGSSHNTADTHLSEAQLATRYALDMAFKDSPSTGGGTVGNAHAGSVKISAPKRNLPVTKVTTPPSQSQKPAPMGSSSKLCSRRKPPPHSTVSADPIQAAAVAAGARIGSPSDAKSLFKAAQSKNAVHIRGGTPLVKTSGNSSPLPPNVHFICTGLATTTSVATGPTPGGQQTKGSTVGPSISQLPKVRSTSSIAMEHNVVQQVESKISTDKC